MSRNLLLDATLLLGLVLLGVVGYRLAPMFAPKSDITLPLSGCDIGRQACVATLPDGGQVEFSIEPRPIPVLKPLQLRATFRGTIASRVEVDFTGSDMRMGYNRPQLVRQDDGRQFAGQTSLPVCITGEMAWDATLLVDSGKSLVAVPFRFVAGH
ncbi:MAG: hypothetical protein NFW04_11090 [Candidatus Accumulibacter sp.]|uniref:hypothetical protein n=1 Tax=Accumulibacter sp. TaxID=2053492 RepID=UPI0025CD2442|nr:hypothetical protein [Accumulibacter sp.]MCM8599184.1 hypothetical protein [Accumulibacter sp.]MCM8663258.1 hypothetical protein [Accumulibacter sp.]